MPAEQDLAGTMFGDAGDGLAHRGWPVIEAGWGWAKAEGQSRDTFTQPIPDGSRVLSVEDAICRQRHERAGGMVGSRSGRRRVSKVNSRQTLQRWEVVVRLELLRADMLELAGGGVFFRG